MENQNIELEAQNSALNENGKALEEINQALDSKNLKLKNILNNVEQCFFNFKKDLLIQEEYSLQCEEIFNGIISYKKLSSVLYPKDENMMKFMDELFIKIFEADIFGNLQNTTNELVKSIISFGKILKKLMEV